MGILDYDIELAKQAIKRTPGLLNEYIGRLNSTLQDKFAINEIDQKRSMRGLDAMAGGDLKVSKQRLDNAIAQKMVNVGLDMNPAAVGQIVWHGSPHKFNKFDMSKIGTGEGAQAYGHGLYMAEAPAVAKEYQEKLSRQVSYDGRRVSETHPTDSKLSAAQHAVAGRVADGEDAATAIANEAKSWREQADFYRQYVKEIPEAAEEVKNFETIANHIESLRPESFYKNPGALYKVDIPDEAVARFLDWDKPLSQQAPEVQAAMQNMHVSEELKFPSINMDSMTGREIYDSLMNNNFSGKGKVKNPSATDASFYLGEYGIPGIRYLDGGSRGAGQGSSNFVLFDDQMPRILEINGQATGLQPWAKGEWRGLLGE